MESIFKYANKRKGFVTFLILFVVPFIKVLLHYFISPFCQTVKRSIPNKKNILYELAETTVIKFKALYFELVGNPLYKCLDFSEHFGLLFKEQVFLFVPSIVIVILVVWNFSNTIDNMLSMNKRKENKKKDSFISIVSLNKEIENISSREKTNWEYFVVNLFKEILSLFLFMLIVNSTPKFGGFGGVKDLMAFTLGLFIPYVILKFIYFIYTLINKKPKWPKSYWWLIIPFSMYLFMIIDWIGLSATN
jgi:hypothetical protein